MPPTRLILPFVGSVIDIIIRNNSAVVQFSFDGTTFGDSIILDPGFYSYQLDVKSIKFQNEVAAATASIQAVVYA